MGNRVLLYVLQRSKFQELVDKENIEKFNNIENSEDCKAVE